MHLLCPHLLKAFAAYTLVLWLFGAVVMAAYFGLKYKKDAALVTLAGIAYVQNKLLYTLVFKHLCLLRYKGRGTT